MKQYAVVLGDEHDRVLRYIGDGNRSAGVRKLVEMYVRLAQASQEGSPVPQGDTRGDALPSP